MWFYQRFILSSYQSVWEGFHPRFFFSSYNGTIMNIQRNSENRHHRVWWSLKPQEWELNYKRCWPQPKICEYLKPWIRICYWKVMMDLTEFYRASLIGHALVISIQSMVVSQPASQQKLETHYGLEVVGKYIYNNMFMFEMVVRTFMSDLRYNRILIKRLSQF